MPEPEEFEEKHTPRPAAPQSDWHIGWQIVIAAFLLPVGWLVTGSMFLTFVILGFGVLLMMRAHPAFAEHFEQDPLLRYVNIMAGSVVLLIFIVAIVRNL